MSFAVLIFLVSAMKGAYRGKYAIPFADAPKRVRILSLERDAEPPLDYK